MADKEVTIKVGTDVELGEVQALEDNIKRMKKEKIMLDIQANTERLKAIDSEIETVEAKLKSLKAKPDVDDSEILKAGKELEALEAEKINVAIAVEDSKLKAAEAEIEDLDGTEIDVDVNNISAMQSIEQIGQGFDRLKQGASEIGEQMGTVLEAAGKQETNKTFLEMSVGAEQAAKSLETINGIVQKLPGDDTALQGLLSSAAAKNASLTASEMEKMGVAAADYFSAMSYYGKSATEAQQDMTNYLLAGNTAELERSPIMQAHIDKLKEASTVQERINALQEALNDEGWAGMSQQDTYNNKLETFNGMLERGKYNLGGMFQEGAKNAMDFALQLDDATGGLVGMGLALASFASPITDTVMGLGQIATGFKSLKDAADWAGIGDKLGKLKDALGGVKTKVLELATDIKSTLVSAFTTLKTTMTGTVIPALKSAAMALWTTGKEALTAGLNALKSAAMWAYQKLAMIASTVAEYGLAAAQALLNAVMSMNPIMIVVLALAALVAALVWAYYNVDWFREMVDGAWQSLVQLGQQIYGVVAGALQWLGDLFNQFTSQLGLNTDDWIQAVLGFILFLPTLPLQAAIVFTDMIAKALGFGDNFTNTMIGGAIRAVVGFINKIKDGVHQFASAIEGIPNALKACLDWAYDMVMSHPIVQALKWLGDKAAEAFAILGLGQGSPGKIYHALENELNWSQDMVKDSKLPKSTAKLGSDMVDSFSPAFDIGDMKLSNGSIDRAVNVLSHGGGDIIINIEGDVDSEKRVNQIVEVIRRELNWNNTTAGRTV